VDWLIASIGITSAVYGTRKWVSIGRLSKIFAVGLYHNGLSIDLDVDKSDLQGEVEEDQHGPFLALTASW